MHVSNLNFLQLNQNGGFSIFALPLGVETEPDVKEAVCFEFNEP